MSSSVEQVKRSMSLPPPQSEGNAETGREIQESAICQGLSAVVRPLFQIEIVLRAL